MQSCSSWSIHRLKMKISSDSCRNLATLFESLHLAVRFSRVMFRDKRIQPCGGEPSYAALRLPSLYHEDRELVRLVRQGLLGQLRAAVEHRLSNPNTIVPEKSLGV